MSLRAMLWALNDAPVDDPTTCLVLIALADGANDDGTGAYPSKATMAKRARCSERTVQRHLRELESLSLIRQGDQTLALRFRGDRRPTVYDLNLGLARGDNLTPREAARGDTGDAHGETPVSDEPSIPTGTRPTTTPTAARSADPIKDEATKIVKEWWDSLDVKPAGQRAWFACVGAVSAMLKAGHPVPSVTQALRTAGTPVTVARLELEMHRKGRRQERLPDWSDGTGF